MSRSSGNPDNLYQRNGVWWIRYHVGGRKVRRSLGTKSVREAKRLRDQILAKRTAAAKFGIEPPTAEPVQTFEQIATMWLQSRLADDSLRPHTRKNNRLTVNNVLIPEFGPLLMTEVTPERIERFIVKLRRRISRATTANYFTCFRTIVRQSIKRGWFPGPNPIDRMARVPTHGPGRDTTLTEDEAERLLGHLNGAIYYKTALALYTGLRWGEVHGLAWADLSLDTDPQTLTVRRSYRGKPKNQASADTVPISADATAIMRRWATELRRDWGEILWVFPNANGQIHVHGREADAKAIHKATRAAGIAKHITPHVFRHTFGTWVYERTGDPKIVQRLMRHKSFETSMRYVHDRRELAPVVNLLPNITSRHHLRLI